jgi:hypothetical protein
MNKGVCTPNLLTTRCYTGRTRVKFLELYPKL